MFFKTKPTRGGGLLRPIAHFFTILIFIFFKVVDEPILRLPFKNLGAKILGCRDIGISSLKQNLDSQGGAPRAPPSNSCLHEAWINVKRLYNITQSNPLDLHRTFLEKNRFLSRNKPVSLT